MRPHSCAWKYQLINMKMARSMTEMPPPAPRTLFLWPECTFWKGRINTSITQTSLCHFKVSQGHNPFWHHHFSHKGWEITGHFYSAWKQTLSTLLTRATISQTTISFVSSLMVDLPGYFIANSSVRSEVFYFFCICVCLYICICMSVGRSQPPGDQSFADSFTQLPNFPLTNYSYSKARNTTIKQLCLSRARKHVTQQEALILDTRMENPDSLPLLSVTAGGGRTQKLCVSRQPRRDGRHLPIPPSLLITGAESLSHLEPKGFILHPDNNRWGGKSIRGYWL